MARRNARSVSEAIVKYSGIPVYLGSIDSVAATKTNASTSTPFNITAPYLLGKVLMLQADQDFYFAAVNSSTGGSGINTAQCPLITSGERVIVTMSDIDGTEKAGEFLGWLAIKRSTADGTVKVFELT